ncbi:energy-coupling factor transporter transmembrane protein EcfT [Coriobacteriales bacterium OH1046]|nr:energy-coupling factor transporter transmembrane protein EcfT [Coriobacteriales bacterium OH1046]
MAFKLSLGQYWPSESILHHLDPRTKVGGALVIMASVFFVDTLPRLALGWAVALALVALSRVPAGKVLGSVRAALLMLTLLSVCNLLLVRSGEVLVSCGIVTITSGGVRAAMLYSLRLVVAVIAAALLLLTTTPTELTDAFDAALAPLSRLGLPGHELAMVFSLMLRFVPTLADDASAVIDAQTARGGGLAEGPLVKRIRSVVPVVAALLAGSLRHAEDLSRALDARCYEGGAARSHWHPLHMKMRDWVALASMALYVAALILLG